MTINNLETFTFELKNMVNEAERLKNKANKIAAEADLYYDKASGIIRQYLETFNSIKDVVDIYNSGVLNIYDAEKGWYECKRRINNIADKHNIASFIDVALPNEFIRITINKQKGASRKEINNIIKFITGDKLPPSHEVILAVEDIPNGDISRGVINTYSTTISKLDNAFIKDRLS